MKKINPIMIEKSKIGRETSRTVFVRNLIAKITAAKTRIPRITPRDCDKESKSKENDVKKSE